MQRRRNGNGKVLSREMLCHEAGLSNQKRPPGEPPCGVSEVAGFLADLMLVTWPLSQNDFRILSTLRLQGNWRGTAREIASGREHYWKYVQKRYKRLYVTLVRRAGSQLGLALLNADESLRCATCGSSIRCLRKGSPSKMAKRPMKQPFGHGP